MPLMTKKEQKELRRQLRIGYRDLEKEKRRCAHDRLFLMRYPQISDHRGELHRAVAKRYAEVKEEDRGDEKILRQLIRRVARRLGIKPTPGLRLADALRQMEKDFEEFEAQHPSGWPQKDIEQCPSAP